MMGSPLSSEPSSLASLAWNGRPLESHPPALLMDTDSPADLTESISPRMSRDCTIRGLGDVSKAVWKRGNTRSFVGNLVVADGIFLTEAQRKGCHQMLEAANRYF